MSLWKIAWRSIEQRALASFWTGVSMALGVALVVTVLVVHSVVDRFFRHSSQGYDMIIGATKGGRLQLVLNTVYHLSQPVENLPYSFYKEFLKDGDHAGKYASLVDVAVPVCLGDSYEQFRVVGTTPEMFEAWEPYQKYEFAAGRNFEQESFFEGVIGSVVASQTGLKVGSTFQPSHGIEAEGGHKHDAFTVVGILKPTGTPNDRALFINMEGFYLLRGHAKEEEGEGHEQKAESAEHDEHTEHGHADEREHPDHDAHHDEAMHDEHDEHGDNHEEHADEHHEADHHHDEHEAAGKRSELHEDHADADHEHADHDHAEHADRDHDHAGADHEHTGHGDEDHEHGEHGHSAQHEHGHNHAHTPLPESQREITAILVRTSPTNLMASMTLQRKINKGNEAQAVLPGNEIAQLLEMIVGNLRLLLLALSVLIVIVAGIGIMVSIYNSMSDRRREIAVMRSLGARRSTVLSIILLESILLSMGGGAAGWLLGHGLLAAASPWVMAKTGFAMGGWQFSIGEAWILPGLLVLASLAGYVPGLAAYRTDVAKALSSAP